MAELWFTSCTFYSHYFEQIPRYISSLLLLRGLLGAKSYDSALGRASSYTFWKIFGVSEKVACDIQLFTGVCSLEDTLNKRRLSFWSGLANTGNDVIIT